MSKRHRSPLRWPGNKYSMLDSLIELFPRDYNNYHEPFLGSASVFLNNKFKNEAYISDINPDLINFYSQVKENLNQLSTTVSKKINTEDFFYKERSKTYSTNIEKAAQFYFLNRTCFNGIYRVNSKGKFNVPYGKRVNLKVLDFESLKYLSDKLVNTNFKCQDFEKSIANINKSDFIFLDPPYSSKVNNENFLMYNQVMFNWNDQIRLKEYCSNLNDIGAKYLLTNLYNKSVLDLFHNELGLEYFEIERFSKIGGQMKSRGIIKEYIFRNF